MMQAVLEKRAANRKGRKIGDDQQFLKVGDLVVLSSIEEDERAYLSSVSTGDDHYLVVQSGSKKKTSVFEIHPMIHNSAKKALQKGQKSGVENVSLLEENAKKEIEQNEAVNTLMEGTPICYGQIIQLTHSESGHQFLTGSTSEAAILEQSCGKIYLRHETGKKCWFKFLSLDEKSEGKIPLGASVVLVQASNSDMYVHRSSWTDEQGDFEANLAPTPTHWIVELFDSGKRNLKSGAMIRLQHQKAGFLISSFVREKDSQNFKESVLFQYVPPGHREQPEESTNSIWVLESPTSAVSFRSQVRFNVWGSNKYLAILKHDSGQFSVVLKTTKDADSLFTFGKSDQKDTSNAVTLNSFVNLQHVKTGHWIKGVPLLDQSAHWAVECQAKMSQSEIIRLIPVSQSQVSLISFLQHQKPEIESYVEKLREKRPLHKIGFIEENIIDLIQWLIDPPPPKENPMTNVGKPIKKKQYLLGNPAMLELLVELVVLPFSEGYNTYQALEKIPEFRYQCELVYWLLAKITYCLPKVSALLFKYMNEFSKQAGAKLPVYPLLEEIFRDNKSLSQMLEPEQLAEFIRHMTALMIRSSTFLDFLVQLCVSDGQAIISAQDMICRSLLQENPNYFLKTKTTGPVKEGGMSKILISDDGEENWIRIDDFLWTADRSLVQFHASSLSLFRALCFGRNSTCIATVETFITAEETLSAIMCPDLPFSLRKAYCEVLHYVYFDRHPHKKQTIMSIHAIRDEGQVSDSVSGEENYQEGQSLEEEEEVIVEEELKDELRATFQELEPKQPEEDGVEMVVMGEEVQEEKKLPKQQAPKFRRRTDRGDSIWKRFVEYFENMLDGIKHPSSVMNEFSVSLFRILKAIMSFNLYAPQSNSKILNSLTRVLQLCLEEDMVGKVDESRRPPEYEIMLEVKFEICAIFEVHFLHSLKLRFDAMINKCKKKGANIPRIVEAQISSEKKNLSSDIRRDKGREKVLMDLLYHRHQQLSGSAMRLLVSDVTSQLAAYENIARKMKFLKSKEEVGLHDTVTETCIPMLNEASDSLQDCNLRELMDKLKKLLEMCSPNQKLNVLNQSLLAHLGVHNSVINFLESMPRNVKEEIESVSHQPLSFSKIDYRTIYALCNLFLQHFCRANGPNQAVLFSHLDLFFSLFSLGILAEETVTAILTDNVTLCRKLSPQYILTILSLIRKNPTFSLKLLKLLQAIAMPGGRSNRPIQNLILKQIVAHSSELCPYLNPEESHHLIMYSESEDFEDQALVSYYVQLVNVLSACSYGKSHTAEAMCQGLLPLKVILNTLEETRNVELQSAFARFLDEVWFYTEIVEPQLMFIQNNPQLWKIFGVFHNQMMSYCTFLKNLTRHFDTHTDLKEGLEKGDDFQQFAITKLNVGSWTIYLCDQVIPLLEHFFAKHFRKENVQREQIDVTAELFDAATAMMQTKLRHKERVLKIESFLETLIVEELIDRQRADRAQAAISAKKEDLAKRVASHSREIDFQKEGSREGEFDPHSIVEFRLAEEYVPIVFPRLARHLKTRAEKFLYAELLTEVIKDGSIDDMELKLSCLRLLRYIIYKGPVEEIYDEPDRVFLSLFQLHLAELQLVPATLALLGPAGDDDDVCTQALDLAMVLTYQNKTVRDMLMDFYFTVAEEVIWMDLRTLIQKSIDHVRKQKASRNALYEGKIAQNLHHHQHYNNPTLTENGESKIAINKLEPVAPQYHQLPIPDIGKYLPLPYTKMVFRFMQSLCADHDPKVQRYLRQQEDNYQNADLVRESVVFLRMIDDFCNPDTVDDILQCILFMQDLVIGSRENQLDLVSYGVCESLDYLLKREILTPFGSEEYALKEANLQVKVSELLLTLLEGNSDTAIPTTMITTLNFNALLYHASFLEGGENGSLPNSSLTREFGDGGDYGYGDGDGDGDYGYGDGDGDGDYGYGGGDGGVNGGATGVGNGFGNGFGNGGRKGRSGDRDGSVVKKKIALAGNTFRLIKMLGEVDASKVPEEYQDLMDSAFSMINEQAQSYISRIEIVAADRSLQRLYFPVPMLCQPPRTVVEELQADLENHLAMGKTNWQSTTERVEEFCRWCENLLIQFEYMRRQGDHWQITHRPKFIICGLFFALVLNVLVVAFANPDKGFGDTMDIVLRVLGCFELVIAVIILVGFFRMKGTTKYYIRWKDLYTKVYQNDKTGDLPNPSILFRFEERDAYIRRTLPYLWPPRQMPLRSKLIFYTSVGFLTDFHIDGAMYQILYLLAVLLGIVVHPFFYCFLLLDIVRISRSLQTVLRTIYYIALTLLFIGLLIVALIWIGSLYVFLFVKEAFDPAIGQYCDYPLQCVISLFHIGISFAGAPMEFVTLSSWNDIGSYLGTVIFNIIFYIFVGMILFNIIFAVIVDKFGDLRDTRASLKSGFLNRCFICSIEREIFQRVSTERGLNLAGKKVFVDHINQDHRPWDYLFFFEYLKYKDPPMTSNEEHVKRQIENSRWLSFMPVGRAKILEGEEEETISLEERIGILSKSTAVLTRLVTRLQTKVDNFLSNRNSTYQEKEREKEEVDPLAMIPSESFDSGNQPLFYSDRNLREDSFEKTEEEL